MVRAFYEEFQRLWRKLEHRPPCAPEKLHGTVLTVRLFAPVLRGLLARLNNRFGTRLHTVAVENHYFGPDIVVAGLITGQDILAARNDLTGDFIIVPSVAFKSDEPIMLDGTRQDEIEQQIGLPLRVADFKEFARMLGDS